MYKYILFSVLLHASISTSMWLLKDKSANNSETVSFEILNENKVHTDSRLTKKINKQINPQLKENTLKQIESTDLLNQESQSITQRINLQNSVTHPYFKDLWQILKKKKKNLSLYSNIKENYTVSFILKKNGTIEEIEVKGSQSDVAKEIIYTLSESAELPPVPDDVSKNDLEIHYQVEI